MRRVLIAFVGLCLTLSVSAQPARSRVAQNNQRLANVNNSNVTSRAALMFPTAVDVPQDVTWRRDIYRSLDLTRDENAALYYPIEPHDGKINLFTLLFQLLSKGQIPAYYYELSGLENFSNENRVHFKDLLERFNIDYEIEGNSIKVMPGSMPSNLVKSYFIKESSYYDQNTSTYHSRVVALCPILHDVDYNKPMFWVKISDIEAYLSQHMIMTSNINNAAVMSMADFFATNKYKGDIYMTSNMQGRTLAEEARDRHAREAEREREQYMRENPYDEDSEMYREENKVDSITLKEQKRIEKQLVDFEKHIWNPVVDSTAVTNKDSINAVQQLSSKTKKTVEKSSRTNTRSTARASKKKEKSPSSSGSSGNSPRVSVRRQRH